MVYWAYDIYINIGGNINNIRDNSGSSNLIKSNSENNNNNSIRKQIIISKNRDTKNNYYNSGYIFIYSNSGYAVKRIDAVDIVSVGNFPKIGLHGVSVLRVCVVSDVMIIVVVVVTIVVISCLKAKDRVI